MPSASLISARLVDRYLAKLAKSITLLPADSEIGVWRDVFVSRLPNMPSTSTPGLGRCESRPAARAADGIAPE